MFKPYIQSMLMVQVCCLIGFDIMFFTFSLFSLQCCHVLEGQALLHFSELLEGGLGRLGRILRWYLETFENILVFTKRSRAFYWGLWWLQEY